MSDSQASENRRLKLSDQELCEFHIQEARKLLDLAVKHLDCATDRAKQHDKDLSGSLAYTSGQVLAITVILSDIASGNYRVDV